MPDQSVNISASGGVTIKKFSGEDDEYEYEDWRDSVEYLIRLKKLKHVLDKSFKLPAAPGKDDAEKKLIEDNEMALTWVLLATTGAPKQLIKHETIARDAIEKLNEEFDLGSETYDLEELNAKFDALKLQDGDKPSVFFVRMDDLNAKFEKFHIANGKEYKKDSKELLIKIASCVDEDSKYDSVIKTWKTKCTSSSDNNKLSDLKKVLKAYYKENMRESESGRLVMSMSTVPVCSHCNKKGHTEAQCWLKHPELKPSKYSKSKSEKSDGGKDGGKKLGPCWICGGPHRKKQCPKYQAKKDDAKEDSVNGLFLGMTTISNQVCMQVTKETQVEDKKKGITFLADTGSMTHAICDDGIVLEKEKNTLEKVQGFDGTGVLIKKKGDLTLKDRSTGCLVKLTNTRKSNFIKKNIISIGQLQSEGWSLRGSGSRLTMKKGDDLLHFSKGNEENLYYMDATVVSKDDSGNRKKSKPSNPKFSNSGNRKVEVFGVGDDEGWTKVGDESKFPSNQVIQESSKSPSNVPKYGGCFAIISDDEGGILLGEDSAYTEVVEQPTDDPVESPSQPRCMQTRSMTRNNVEINLAEKKKVLTDGVNKVTGNTTVRRIEFDDGLAVLEEEKKGKLSGLINSALFIFNTALNSDPGEPKTDKEALEGPESRWWRPACVAEINNFLNRDSWRFVPRQRVEKLGRKLIGTKMVYKKKDETDGTTRFKARCVSKGFMQIPGVDFTERFSPVATDTSNRIVLALILFFWDSHGWRPRGIDIEAAFLEGDLDKPYYLEPPYILVLLGFMTEKEFIEYCIELQKGMYGQCDAALRFFIRFTKYLESDRCEGVVQCKSDPCIFYKKDENGFPLLVFAVTVDDCLMGGTPKEMDIFMKQVEKVFNIVKEMEMKKHLGISFDFKRDENGDMCVICTMEKKVQDIVSSYEDFIGTEAKIFPSPGAPNSVLDKNSGDVVDINMYRSLVGKVMFFATKVGPKMCNQVRDLARHMSNPGEQHWKALGRLIGYMKGMKLKGMVLRKPIDLRNVSLVDADFGKDPVTRKSVGGELHTLGGCLTSFSSKGEKSISNSTVESEYKSLSNGGREVKFQQMLLEEIAYVKTPAILLEDNEGCEFLVKNKQVSSRTKHIDIAMHSIREFCSENDNGITRGMVMRVSSEENTSDICTKNADVATFRYHEEEIDNGFPRLRQKVFDSSTMKKVENQKLLGRMSSEGQTNGDILDHESCEVFQ